jgi:hypothetical protein
MKYTIMGFSQKRLLSLGLGMDEAMILRWLVDYRSAGTIRTMTIDGQEWLWINYGGVLADIPIVAGSVKTLTRRFERLVEAGVLVHQTVKEGGTYSCFRIVEETYLSLIDDPYELVGDPDGKVKKLPADASGEPRTEVSDGGTDLSDGQTEMSEGVGQNWERGSDKSVRPKDTITNKIQSLDKTQERERAKARFSKPTVQEISRYCQERENGIDGQSFFDFYESKGWMVGSSPMKDWKAAVRTWESKGRRDAPERGFRTGRVNEAWAGRSSGRFEL